MHPVDEPLGDGDHADVAARLHAALGGASLAPATRQRHLQAIRARAATLPAPAAAPNPAAGGLGRRLASTLTAAGLVVVMGASGAVAAAHDALPGHLLYPVKQVTEQLALAAPLPAEQVVQRHLTFADRRLHEAATLTDRDADPALVAEAIAAHTRLLARADELAGDDRQLTGRVDAATAAAQTRLLSLLDRGLPEVAADQARAALSAAEVRLDRRPAAPPPAPQTPPPASPRDPAAPERRPQPPATPTPPGPPDRTPAPDARPTPGPPADPGPRGQRPQPQPRQPGPATPAPPAPEGTPPGAQGPGAGEDTRQAPSAGQQAATDRALPGGGPPGNAQGTAGPAR